MFNNFATLFMQFILTNRRFIFMVLMTFIVMTKLFCDSTWWMKYRAEISCKNAWCIIPYLYAKVNLLVYFFWNKKADIIFSLFEFGAWPLFIHCIALLILSQNLTVGGTANQYFWRILDLPGFDSKESNGWKKLRHQILTD